LYRINENSIRNNLNKCKLNLFSTGIFEKYQWWYTFFLSAIICTNILSTAKKACCVSTKRTSSSSYCSRHDIAVKLLS